MCLFEVKPVKRSMKMVPIQMQESAQMVAWIKSESDLEQGRDKMYGTFPLLFTFT